MYTICNINVHNIVLYNNMQFFFVFIRLIHLIKNDPIRDN